MKNDIKSLKKKALKKLLEITEDKNFTLNSNPIQILESIESLSKINNENSDKIISKFLNQFLKFQSKNGNFIFENTNLSPIYFLKTISKYLSIKQDTSQTKKDSEDLGIISNKNSLKKEIKEYIRYIEKSIYFIEENFDNTYLLIKSTHKVENEYFAYENALFLSISDELSEILNQFDYNSIADRIFMLKGKMELGYLRYFFNKETNKIISSFKENGNYILAEKNQEYNIILTYSPNEEKYKEVIKEIKENSNYEKINILYYLNNLIKINEKKLTEKIVNENYKILEKFPQEILTIKDFKIKNIISKSINKDFKIETIELKKEKLVLINLNHIDIINLILKL